MGESQEPAGRRYRLPALDRSGVMLGLSLPEMIFVGVGSVVTLVLMPVTPAVIAVAPLVVTFVATKLRWRGLPLFEWAPPLWHWRRFRRPGTWSTTSPWTGSSGDLPPCLAGLRVTPVTGEGTQEMAVVWDRFERTAAAVLRVPGADFSMLDDDAQEAMLDAWGLALSAHALEGSPVLRLGWTEVARRSSLDEHVAYVTGEGSDVVAEHRRDYLRLIHRAAPETVSHDVYVTVVVSAQRLRRSAWAAAEVTAVPARLVEELRRSVQVTRRGLKNAGLEVSTVVGVAELARMVGESVDPARAQSLAPRLGGLARQLGLEATPVVGPSEVSYARYWFCTDRSFHRSYWVEDWPRHAVPASWFTPLLASAEGSRRMSVWFTPVTASASHRRIQRQLAKLDADMLTSEEKGRRVSASLRRTAVSVEDREEELVSGYAEADYVGVVTVSAGDLTGLEASARVFEAAAMQAGVVLRPLDRRHDLGWAASLPLGLSAARTGLIP